MVLRIQHSWQGVSGTAEDQFVNTFYCTPPVAPGPSQLLGIADAVRDFYTVVHTPSTEPLTYWMAPTIDGLGRQVRIWDLDDPKPRSPIYDEETSTSFAYGGQALPNEVAVCLSYAAVIESGVPPARRKGRIYLGPLNIRALGAAGGENQQRPDAAMCYAMVNSAQALRDAIFDAGGGAWSLYSPTTDLALAITRVWVDDAWDTQRRRGIDPQSRQSLTLT